MPFAPLNQAVKGGKEAVQLIVEAKGRVCLRTFIGAGPMEQSFAGLPVDEFPPTPVMAGKPLALDATFRDSFRQALDCCSEDCSRHGRIFSSWLAGGIPAFFPVAVATGFLEGA